MVEQGVGRSLYAAAESTARSRGIERLVMDHWTFNVEAAEFFNIRMRKQLPDR